MLDKIIFKCRYSLALISVVSSLLWVTAGDLAAFDNIITLDTENEIGSVNKAVSGTCFIVYDHAEFGRGHKHSYGAMDFGGGVWDPDSNSPVKETVSLLKGAGIAAVRFSTNNYYNWKNAVGDGRKHFLFGVDEFLEITTEIGAESVFIIPFFKTDVEDAADLVEYLNSPADDLHPWALKRSENGHVLPYNVKYFEMGNELSAKQSIDKYTEQYLAYYKAMKAVDPSVQIGVSLDNRNWNNWNNMVMDIIKDKVDFGILHTYPSPFPSIADKKIKDISPLELFRISLGVPLIKDESTFQDALVLLKEKSGKDVPLAITEHNGGFIQNEPVPYRHSLGTALINAELIRIFMKPENNVRLATNHRFVNGLFGMIKTEGDYKKHDYRKPMKYLKRPNYFLYEMYNKHFGETLLDVNVSSGYYTIEGEEAYIDKLIAYAGSSGKALENIQLDSKWRIKGVSGVVADESGGVLRIDINGTSEFNKFIAVKNVGVQPDRYYRLSGYIKTEDLLGSRGVGLLVKGHSFLKRKGSYASTTRLSGNTDWQYVDVVYKTPSYADSITIRVYAPGKTDNVKGTVYVKDVKLEEISPPTHIPYLSVNASKSIDGSKIFLMVINKNLEQALTSRIDLKNYPASGSGFSKDKGQLQINVWTLNGPSVESTNEKDAETVKVRHKTINAKDTSFNMTFEPHSLTAVEIQSVSE